MKLFALLAIFFVSTLAQRCPGINFNGRHFDVETLKEGINRIHQIVFNRNDNTLYFIFDQIAEVPTRVLGYLNIDNKTSGIIEGIRNASAISVDHGYSIVYVGGSEGVYRLNNQRQPERMPIRDDIQCVFYKDVLYYTNSRNEAFVYQNGYINPVFELQGVAAQHLVLDDDNNIFFSQGKSLFRVKIGTRAVNSHESYKVDLLTVDAFDKPYVATKDGVYVYNKYKYVLDKVSKITNLRGLTFGNNNYPIVAILDRIYKLKLSATKCSDTNVIDLY